ncbi:uncharacterized protein EV422DRAFT_567613 [Fimicolochytrium jonesii]|uniref:uncharacterized protein n=1 Tax=Fimicolochytrium jonesii TaxID=1396493 RepID=UPI0022FDC31F|nr:uncharacterized protein EV422DRAFT_567613 [Fimicolochytrium jonesii]KAI8820718.1 hypothetical protein EV422DRAFT_567613 [Fimicolochytrium jonesii]
MGTVNSNLAPEPSIANDPSTFSTYPTPTPTVTLKTPSFSSSSSPRDIELRRASLATASSFSSSSSWETQSYLHGACLPVVSSSAKRQPTTTPTMISTTSNPSYPPNTNPFPHLPTDLLLLLLQHLPPSTLHRFSLTCRQLHVLIQSNTEALYRHRVLTRFRLQPQRAHHSFRLRHEGIQEQTWADMYWRLSVLRTRWVGWALDRATNAFECYPMEFVVKNVAVAGDEGGVTGSLGRSRGGAEPTGRGGAHRRNRLTLLGICRWRTIADAITKVKGTLTVSETHSTSITFKETQLIRGPPNTVAVPNTYTAECFGSVMLGMYDPNASAHYRGVFALVMEECFWAAQEGADEVISFTSGETHFGVVTTVDAAQQRVYARCRLGFGGDGAGEFVMEADSRGGQGIHHHGELNAAGEHAALVTMAQTPAGALHFSPKAEPRAVQPWWAVPPVAPWPCLPEGRVDIRKVGNVVLGMFVEPVMGCFYIGL